MQYAQDETGVITGTADPPLGAVRNDDSPTYRACTCSSREGTATATPTNAVNIAIDFMIACESEVKGLCLIASA
jgi:hypothetical protein